jgi:GMP synthase-like glutamine amidotransferase
MKIGILETGRPPAPLVPDFGDYPGMFVQLLKDAGLEAETTTFDVQALEFPERPDAFDAYLITGSAAGVYEDLPWIAPLERFLVEAKGKAKLVGVCFGHQIMAQAFGGKVIKSPKGWGIGLQAYEVFEREPWMDDDAPVAVAVSHQDQVVEAPPGARAVAGDAFCPLGVLVYDDQPALSLQHHPEFDPAYAKALIERRLETVFDEATGRAAIESLDAPNDRARVGGWIRAFLEA